MRVLHNGPLVLASGLMTTAAASLMLAVAPPLAAADPPAGKAYELVSPNDPSGTPAGVASQQRPFPGLASADGERLLFGAVSSLGEAANGAQNPPIFGRRTDTGWEASTALRTTDQGETATELITSEARNGWANPDITELAFTTQTSLGPPNLLPNGSPFYRVAVGGAPEWLSQPEPGRPTAGTGSAEIIASSDLSTVAFESTSPLTADAPPQGTRGVYARRNGVLELVSVLPDGSLPTVSSRISNPGVLATSADKLPALTYRNAVSGDGRTVLFALDDPSRTQALYVRDLDTNVTRALADGANGALPIGAAASAAPSGSAWGPSGDIFESAGPDWSVMPGYTFSAPEAPVTFFRSAANLAPGASGTAPNKVYRADLLTGNLTYVAGIDGPPIGVSRDGTRVLFLRPTGATDDPWTVRFWDAASPSTSVAVGTTAETRQTRSVRSSRDGRTWVFTSTGSMDPDSAPADPTRRQLYRWTVGDAAPTCLSCDTTDGVARTKGANLSQAESEGLETLKTPAGIGTNTNQRAQAFAKPSRAISDDGTRVAFDSPDRLLPGDENNFRDVYLWDANEVPERRLQLVTSGSATATAPAYYVDITADGDDVFFTTQEGLVASDVDKAYDVYVARKGGGIPGDNELPCVGDACRPPVVTPPTFGSPESILDGPVTRGPAVTLPKTPAKFRVRSPRVVKQTVRVTVDTPAAGRITVSGRNAKSRSRTAKRSTAYTIPVNLSAAGRRALTRDGKVRLRLTVKFKAATGGGNASSTVVATIRRAGR